MRLGRRARCITVAPILLAACGGPSGSHDASDATGIDAPIADAVEDAFDALSDDARDAAAMDVRDDADASFDVAAPLLRHVLTWDYYGGSLGASPSVVPATTAAPWLSWSDTSDASLIAAGVKTYLYSSPLILIAPNDEFYPTLVETDFAHTCAGTTMADRISLNGYANSYITDPGSTHLGAAWASWVNGHAAQHDLVFMDAADIFWEPLSAAPCAVTADAWLAAEATSIDELVAMVRYPTAVMINGVWPVRDAAGTWGLPHTMPLFDDAHVAGARMEGCFIEPYNPMVAQKIPGAYWAAELSTALAIVQRGKLWFCMSGWNAPTLAADTSTDQRLYAYASFLLAYDLDHAMIGEGFSTPSNFRVEPETQLVAAAPSIAMPADASALLTTGTLAGGLFVREYDDCAFAGMRVGRCAAVVNNDASSAHAFARAGSYAHTLSLSGGGVLPSDGGSADPNGPAPPAMVPTMTGLIAIE